MNTPLDEFIKRHQVLLLNNLRNKNRTRNNTLIELFAETCRVLYIQMSNASATMFTFNPLTTSPNVNYEYFKDALISCKLSYFQFTEQISFFGRLLKGRGFEEPPTYNRINFYRNKSVAHYDQYIQINLENGFGIGFTSVAGKIIIPDHPGKANKPNWQKSSLELIKSFSAAGVTLKESDFVANRTNSDYSELVFSSLEKIDPNLISENPNTIKQKSIYIPESVVKNLFNYKFPTPINDMEDYYKSLVRWFEKITKTKV